MGWQSFRLGFCTQSLQGRVFDMYTIGKGPCPTSSWLKYIEITFDPILLRQFECSNILVLFEHCEERSLFVQGLATCQSSSMATFEIGQIEVGGMSN